jgi:virulence-associated protein VagC
METTGRPTRTRVFRAGNSRAVRIPKAFDLPEGDVFIERREGGLFISPLRGRWDLFFAEPGVEFPLAAADLRDNRAPRGVRLARSGRRAAPVPRRTAPRRKR